MASITSTKVTKLNNVKHVESRILPSYSRNIFVAGNVAEAPEKGPIEQAVLFAFCHKQKTCFRTFFV